MHQGSMTLVTCLTGWHGIGASMMKPLSTAHIAFPTLKSHAQLFLGAAN